MRRKPFGKLLPSAHAVDREFRVIAALGRQGFPVAKAYALCTDDAVIGAAFYIMSMEEGRVFWDPTLPSQPPETRHAIFTSKIETLAKLHTYDPQAIGLGDFGKPGNYFARQVDRWTKQYRASETQHIPEVEKLVEWLPRTVPEQQRVSIVHGDYRLDNMIFHPTEPRVKAVLDWELSTLGDPMADFTYLLMQWTMPGLVSADLKALNIPSMEEAAQIYCNATGSAVPDLNWYFSYNLFRLAGITQGIAGRRGIPLDVADGLLFQLERDQAAQRADLAEPNAGHIDKPLRFVLGEIAIAVLEKQRAHDPAWRWRRRGYQHPLDYAIDCWVAGIERRIRSRRRYAA